MTIANVALRSVAKLERSVANRDVGVNYADWHEFGYYFLAIYKIGHSDTTVSLIF